MVRSVVPSSAPACLFKRPLVMRAKSAAANGFDQGLVIDWLFQEVNCALAHCAHPKREVRVAGYEDQRSEGGAVPHFGLELKSTLARQMNIHHPAIVWPVIMARLGD